LAHSVMESLSDFNEKKEMAVFISTAIGSERGLM
jgi:hypothetical protein